MNKKNLLLLFVGALFLSVWINRIQLSESLHSQIPFASPAATRTPAGHTVTDGENTYTVFVQRINPQEVITLISNFTEKDTTAHIMETHQCQYGVNAGFYTTDAKPLGVYLQNGIYINRTPHNPEFFNGYVFQKTKQGLDFADSFSQNSGYQFLFETGPLFYINTQLNIQNDEPDRRVLIAKTSDKELYLLAITEKDNRNGGPRLEQIPKLLAQMSIPFTQIVNLDGGSASAFYADDGTSLQELTPVGSFLCGKIPS